MVYRFIDENKEYFGLRWLCLHFGISMNCYYNYLKNNKCDYHKQQEIIYERIKYIFYNNNRTVGHRTMKVFLSRYGIHLSKTTVHKYMNKTLNLAAVIMRKKPGYKLLWSSIFVTLVAKKICWIVAWIIPESPVYVKDASHRLWRLCP